MTIASRSGGRLESDSVALPLKSLDGPSPDAVGIPASVVVGAGFLIDGAAGQEVVRGNEHREGMEIRRPLRVPYARSGSALRSALIARQLSLSSRAEQSRGGGRLKTPSCASILWGDVFAKGPFVGCYRDTSKMVAALKHSTESAELLTPPSA
jgi:hypothetical protein